MTGQSVVQVREASTWPPSPPASRSCSRPSATATCTCSPCICYQSTQAALPKLFALRLDDLVGSGTFGVGALVAVAYAVAGLTQIAAGHLADRYPLKQVYTTAILSQVPLLWLASRVGGLPIVPLATGLVIANTASLPAENILLAESAPRRQSLAFGVKFVLSFGAAPFAIRLVAFVTERTGGFAWLFVALTGVALFVGAAALLLPKGRGTDDDGAR